MKYKQAAEADSSTEWMLPSTHKAGLSAAGPLSASVTVTSGISRPSWLRPIVCSATKRGCSAASARSTAMSSS